MFPFAREFPVLDERVTAQLVPSKDVLQGSSGEPALDESTGEPNGDVVLAVGRVKKSHRWSSGRRLFITTAARQAKLFKQFLAQCVRVAVPGVAERREDAAPDVLSTRLAARPNMLGRELLVRKRCLASHPVSVCIGYSSSMYAKKIATSLPARDYNELERLRKRLRLGRSAAVQEAVAMWLAARKGDQRNAEYIRGYLEKPDDPSEARALVRAWASGLEPEDW